VTLKRDPAYMKDRLTAPIICDRDANGYRFDNATTDGPIYELPGLWFIHLVKCLIGTSLKRSQISPISALLPSGHNNHLSTLAVASS
jgi:hypothetical protein